MSLDRELQRRALEMLKWGYPRTVSFTESEWRDGGFQYNLYYLQDHGLIKGMEMGREEGMEKVWSGRAIVSAKITVKGLDFLEDDGGLGAILNTVTVRFDVNSVRSLLEDKIIASTLSPEEKETLREKIKSFSGEMMKEVLLKFVDKGLDRPELWPVLMGLVSRVSGVSG